ncbi:hypothetical protein [Nocardiopsis ganjiahuensis]|uniref:hypothetical protein n=1 Tax=Nocardiopsis ganjiahuensis TaxID=239984 RepID=UPI00034B704D|nr:hypothetical protein [Nocardiopsis ganjiahuensis]
MTEDPAADPAPEQGPVETASLEEPEDIYAFTDPELTERLHLPLYDYILDEYEYWTVGRAQNALVVECLGELGFEAEASPSTVGIEAELTHHGPFHDYRLYGMASVDLAEEYGFETPSEEGPWPQWTVADGVDAQMAQAAADGYDFRGGDIETPSGDPVPEGGCNHQANLGISPDSPAPEEGGMWIAGEDGLIPDTPGRHHLADLLAETAHSTAREDTEVAAAAEAWKECVGLSETTVDPEGAPEVLDDEDAVLSAECLDSTGYPDAFVDAQTRAQEPLIEEHGDDLAERKEQLDAELAAARAVLDW